MNGEVLYYSGISCRLIFRGACAINALNRLRHLVVLFVLGLTITACGSGTANVATRPPQATVTPRATLLPTVAALVPFGTVDRPYHIVLVPPAGSSVTGTALADFIKERTGLNFKVDIVATYADVLQALCIASPGNPPTFGWLDGWTLLTAQAQGCGTIMLRTQQNGAMGVKADIVISPAAQIDTLAVLHNRAKTRDFCRVSSDDDISWILPVVLMRTTPGFDPLTAFRNIRDYGDTTAMLQDVSDNKCVAAIASGTLSTYKLTNIADITRTVKVLATTPELPYGGLVASPDVPRPVASQVSSVFADHLDQLKDLVTADALVPATPADLADLQKTFDAGGFNLAALGS
ncbi:MAG: PhnD/SsuA/transferrin family substrate-binding protein [Chloroflexota bacterium]